MTDPTLRSLSGLERAWLVAGRLFPPFAIHLVVEAPAPLDADRWRDAIETTAARWPGLRARLTGWLGGTRWVAEDRPLPVDVTDARWSGDHPHPLLDTPLLPGPGARALLMPADGRAVFSAHHALTDGRGLMAFVVDVVRVLGGQPPEGGTGGPLIDAALAREIVDRSPFVAPAKDRAAPFDDPRDLPGLTWRRRRLPAGRRVVPRAVRATAAAAGRALRIGVPVDLRRHRPDLRSSANLTGVAALEIAPADPVAAVRAALDGALSDGAAERNAAAADGLRRLPLWLMTAVARKTGTRAGPVATSAVISSLGRHDLRLDGAPLRVLFVPPGSEELPLFMGLCGDADGIELSAVVPRAWASADGSALDAWLDRFAEAFGDESA